MTKKWVDVPVEVHCHNNWGLATANTLASVAAGPEVIHACINGLGGNAALDECVMGLESLIGRSTGVQTSQLLALSQRAIGFSGTGWYKPFVGPNVSDVEAGIATQQMWNHWDEPGMGREFLNYEVVGGKSVNLVLGKKSGRYSIELKAYELDLPLPSEEQSYKMLNQVKNLAIEKKGLITDDEFKQIYNQVMASKG